MRILIAAALGITASTGLRGMIPEEVAPIVNPDHAAALKAFIGATKTSSRADSKPWSVSFEDCFTNPNLAIVKGFALTVVDQEIANIGKIKVGFSDDRTVALALNEGHGRTGHVRGIKLQGHLESEYPNLQNMIVPVYQAEFPGKPTQCSERFVFEGIYGKNVRATSQELLSDEIVFRVALRGIEILKELHSVGLVHGLIETGLAWLPGDVESIRLRNFGLAKLYFDASTGQHVSVSNCREGSRNMGGSCVSTVVDLTQFSDVLTKLSAGRASADLVAAFKEAVDRLGFTETFDYDFWMAAFRSAL